VTCELYSRQSRFSRQSRSSRRLGTLTAYQRCVIPHYPALFMTVRREIAFLVKHMSCFQGMFNAQFSMFN
jgi:hypothetical protein